MSDKPKLEFLEEDLGPQTPRDKPSFWEGDDPRNDTDNPTYAPDSPSPTRLEEITKESQKDLESISEDDEDPEDPSAEIIQLEDLDKATVSQHRKAFVNWVNNVFYERIYFFLNHKKFTAKRFKNRLF